jgi:hypothetical protein
MDVPAGESFFDRTAHTLLPSFHVTDGIADRICQRRVSSTRFASTVGSKSSKGHLAVNGGGGFMATLDMASRETQGEQR